MRDNGKGLFGWRLLKQQRIVEAQRSQERVEQAADRIAAIVRGAIAEASERAGSHFEPQGFPTRKSGLASLRGVYFCTRPSLTDAV